MKLSSSASAAPLCVRLSGMDVALAKPAGSAPCPHHAPGHPTALPAPTPSIYTLPGQRRKDQKGEVIFRVTAI